MATDSYSSNSLSGVPFPARLFSVDEYHRLGQSGVLADNDRVELLEGRIVTKMIHNPPHDAAVALVNQALVTRLPAGWHGRVQSSITTGDSEPEPDVAVVRGSIRDFVARHPGPSDLALVVEVADSSLTRDREKRRLYARAGIAGYWILNLIDGRLEMYSAPSGPIASPGYGQEKIVESTESVPLIIDSQEVGQITVRDLLP